VSRFRRKGDLPISWNIAPSQDVLAIRFRPKTSQRFLDALRGGFSPEVPTDASDHKSNLSGNIEFSCALPAALCKLADEVFVATSDDVRLNVIESKVLGAALFN
jgi:hypothetical protein